MRRKKSWNDDLDDEIKSWTDQRKLESMNKSFESGINIKCRTKAQKQVIKAIEDSDISIITGPPGTGKTYLSCARALKYIKDDPGTYKRIVLVKSVNVPKDEEIGYLKGSMEEKLEGYVYPFINNFEKIIGKQATLNLRECGAIDILPIKFALGITLDDAIVIVDEAQQISKDNLRTLITRIGENAKMIFLGDIKQKSVNKHQKSALEILIEYFGEIPEIGIVSLSEKDVVRHPIIKKILKIFNKIENKEALNGLK